jgi:hypothetical protein
LDLGGGVEVVLGGDLGDVDVVWGHLHRMR